MQDHPRSQSDLPTLGKVVVRAKKRTVIGVEGRVDAHCLTLASELNDFVDELT